MAGLGFQKDRQVSGIRVWGRGSLPTQGKRRRNRAPVWPPLNGVPIPGFPHPGLDHAPSGIPALPPASCVTLGQLLGLSELQSMCL